MSQETVQSEIDPTSFIPKLEGRVLIKGTIELKVNNVDIWWESFADSWGEEIHAEYQKSECWKLNYRITSAIPSFSTWINHEWKQQSLPWHTVDINELGKFNINAPQFLIDYKIELSLECLPFKSKVWTKQSNICEVTIPAFTAWYDKFQVDQEVEFLAPDKFITEGDIIEILEDNKYKLRYEVWDDEELNYEVLQCIKHVSEIYYPEQSVVARIFKDEEVIYQLLTRQNKDELKLFIAIRDSVKLTTEIDRASFQPFEYFYHQIRPMQEFIAKNVMEFIGFPEFDIRIKCLVDDLNHGYATMQNVRTFDIRQDLGLLSNTALEQVDVTDVERYEDVSVWRTSGAGYGCNICRSRDIEWNYMFICDAQDCTKKHHFCMHCIATTLRLHCELKDVLMDELKGELIKDCIKVICDCVIGTVHYSDIKGSKDDICMVDVSKIEIKGVSNICNRKRKIENDSLCLVKRRKLM